MNTGMIRHGIKNTAATYWVHYLPLEKRVYWYRVTIMLRYIAQKGLVEHIARSKNGQETGVGYIVPKLAFPIQMRCVAPSYDCGVDWKNLTDRETGLLGEAIVEALVDHGVVKFPEGLVTRGKVESQFQATDFEYSRIYEFSFEVKTERVSSQNIFVQTGERSHSVHLAKNSDGTISERFTEADWTEYE